MKNIFFALFLIAGIASVSTVFADCTGVPDKDTKECHVFPDGTSSC